MKKYRLIILYIPVLLLFVACSSEDELTPSNQKNNYFAPDENATDEESILREDFYNTEKCYLLFNDTLRHDSIGVTPDGSVQYFTETVDVAYTMTGTSSYQYSYAYLTTMDEKRQGASFIKDKLLSHLSTKLRPFSWLLVNRISEYDINSTPYLFNGDKSFLAGKRCIAIATENLSGLSEDELKEFATSLFIELIIEKLNAQSAATMKAFTKYSASLYGTSMTEDPIDEEANMKVLNQDGFIEPYYMWGMPWIGLYPTANDDLEAFVKLVLATSEEDVDATYSNYPLVMSKYNALKNIITDLGYIL
ncbi:MAG: hypothetical protein H6Q13_32 [Bacteroidetes bacterium]|nr:hypothetical protein [Bacteroidota bacterium]